MSITREALKAETKLGQIRKNAARAEAKVKADWAARETKFVNCLPLGVRSILRAGGLLEREDMSASILDEPAEKPADIETP